MGTRGAIGWTVKANGVSGSAARADALREILLDRRRRLRAEIDDCSQRLREEGRLESWDEADRAIHEFDRDLGSARVDRLLRMLQQVDEALLRHAEGLYGRCAECDREIPVGRLRSLPFALYCRECQDARERRVRSPQL